MFSVAIVEDDDRFAVTIREYLERYGCENGQEFKITWFPDGAAIADGYRGGFDIILMDIEMGLMNGMEAAAEIRKLDEEVTIIFITNMAQYAIQGYSVHALDYVLKPVSYVALSQSIKKAVNRIDKQTDDYILVSFKNGMAKLRARDILWVESQGHRLLFHTESGCIETTVYSMREIEEKLAPNGFLRASSGVLVNLSKVTGTKNGFVEVGGQYLPVSRGRKNAFMSALVRHMVE